MTRRVWTALCLTLLVVLAGCGGGSTSPIATDAGTPTTTGSEAQAETARPVTETPSATRTATVTQTPTSTETPTPGPDEVSVSGGSLSVDPDSVWRSVQTTMGVDIEQAPSVSVNTLADLREQRRQRSRLAATTFFETMGIRTPQNPLSHLDQDFGGLTYPSGSVELYLGENVTADETRCLLAHEFAHVVQFEQNWDHTLSSSLEADPDRIGGLDSALVTRSLLEGTALAVEKAYVDYYAEVPPCGQSERDAYRDWYRNGSAYSTYLGAPYVVGLEYVESIGASAEYLSGIVDSPPATTEQLLHPGSDDAPLPLSLTVNTSNSSWFSWDAVPMGELVVQTALSANLSLDRAADAAAGWGNDSMVTFQRGADRGFVWVTRWDDAANATEFETAFEDYLADRGNLVDGMWETADGTHWRLVRTTEETISIVVGPEPFV